MQRSRPIAFTSVPTVAERIAGIIGLLDRVPTTSSLSSPAFPSAPRSGSRHKLDGWHVSDNTIYLFQTEYKLPLIDPQVAANIAAFNEHFFPILLFRLRF